MYVLELPRYHMGEPIKYMVTSSITGRNILIYDLSK